MGVNKRQRTMLSEIVISKAIQLCVPAKAVVRGSATTHLCGSVVATMRLELGSGSQPMSPAMNDDGPRALQFATSKRGARPARDG